jgi:hemerythrin-like domain-containing protein
MQPKGMLMAEHRLIEYMLEIIGKEIEEIKKINQVDVAVIDTIIDFIRVYADETHHGKEEKILFAELAKKPMNEPEAKMMQDLINEHVYARGLVKALVEGKDGYAQGDTGKIEAVRQNLEALLAFYPPHIKKEDEDFFLRTEKYFTQEELSAMTGRFVEFDAQMIHEKYRRVCEELNQKYR